MKDGSMLALALELMPIQALKTKPKLANFQRKNILRQLVRDSARQIALELLAEE